MSKYQYYGDRKRRRKAKPCLLCEEQTWDWDYICGSCRRLRDLGQRIENLGTPDETKAVVRSLKRWQSAHYNAKDMDRKAVNDLLVKYGIREDSLNSWVDSSAREALQAAIMKLAGAEGVGLSVTEELELPIGEIKRDGFAMGTQYQNILIDKGRVHALHDTALLLAWMAHNEYMAGLRDGQNFLRKMADGELTIDEINDRSVR